MSTYDPNRYAKWRAETDLLLKEREKIPQGPCGKPKKLDCDYRGKQIETIQCPLPSCTGKIVMLKIYACEKHQKCSLSDHAGVKCCIDCKDRHFTG